MAFKNYEPNHEDVINPYLTFKQAQKLKKKQAHKKLLRDVSLAGRSDTQKEMARMLISNPTSRTSYVFSNPRTKAQQMFHGVEFTEFTAYPSQPIIHGVITISEFDSDGVKKGEKSEDIYMYQPRFEGRNSFVVGPRYTNDGKLNNKAAYAYKDPNTGVIYVGNIPKREIISNRQFDFDATNEENYAKACGNLDIKHPKTKEVVSIKYDTDPTTGYIKTVDLNNAQEKARFDAYCNKYPKAALANNMIDAYIKRIENELKIFEKITERVQEAVDKLGKAKNYQAALSQAQNSQTQSTTSVADENAKLVNDMLKYGIRPTYASPVGGGPAPGVGGMPGGRPGPGGRPAPRPGAGGPPKGRGR